MRIYSMTRGVKKIILETFYNLRGHVYDDCNKSFESRS